MNTVEALIILLLGVCLSVSHQTEEVTPFKINVTDSVLEDLQQRLALARLPTQLSNIVGDQWAYGVDVAYMKSIVEYWKNSFDWRKQEEALNQFAQFTTKIDGLNIHFVHIKSEAPNAIPIIVVHGWPGSFIECKKIIPLLVDSKADLSFDVVCPSIPGYGFSEAPKIPGYGPKKMAGIFTKLMNRLGYSRYVAQGGDWGATITTAMADVDPACVALHLNFPLSPPPFAKGFFALVKTVIGFIFPSLLYTQQEIDNMERSQSILLQETGYMHIQATRPLTLGYALDDSPVGLAAYIIEKFRVWSDCNGDVETRFTKDELLTNVMLYWVNGMTSPMRLYYEAFREEGQSPFETFAKMFIKVPTGFAIFPKEVATPPRSWLEYTYNVTHWTEFKSGGHFAALEEPDNLVEDVRAFLRSLSVVPESFKAKQTHDEL